MKKNDLIVKSNRLINARFNLKTLEQLLFLKMVSMIEKDDTDFKPYEIWLSDFKRERGIKTNDFYQSIYDAAKGLIGKIYEYDNEETHFIAPLLSSFEHVKKTGKIILHVAPKMKPDLLQLKANFTKYYLKNVMKLRCSYAFRIYELLKQVQGFTPERIIEVEEFKNKLGIEKQYRNYKDLRLRVLIPAQKDMNEKTDISFTFEEIKQGRKVKAIRFLITPQETPCTKSEAAQICLVLPEPIDIEKAELRGKLLGYGVTPGKADEIITGFPVNHIKANLEYSLPRSKNNKAGYIVEAIIGDFAGQGEREKKEAKEKKESEKWAKAMQEKAQEWIERLRAGEAISLDLLNAFSAAKVSLPDEIGRNLTIDNESQEGTFFKLKGEEIPAYCWR